MKKVLSACLSLFLGFSLFSQVTLKEVIRYDNKVRGFYVHTPPGYDGSQRLPLVINMHGFTMNGNQQMQYTLMNKKADAENFIVVYPDGISGRWNTGAFFGIEHPYDDVGFLTTIVDLMTFKYNIDPARTYTTGYSAGGFMSLGLGCEMSSRFAAAAPVAANMNYPIFNSCDPERKIPVLFINGTGDKIVPITGLRGSFPPLDSVLLLWTNSYLCDPVLIEDTLPNTNKIDKSRVTLTNYLPCGGSAPVKFYKVLSGGHTWPGGKPNALFGNTNLDINANNEIWSFFEQYTVPGELLIARPAAPSIISLGGSNYRVSWSAIAGATYEVAVWNPSNKVITKYPLAGTSIDVSIPAGGRWSVGAVASSGYKDWSVWQPVPVGMLRQSAPFEASVYPNPAKEVVNVSVNDFSGTVSLFDISGKLLRSEAWQQVSGSAPFTLSGIAPGMYMLALENNAGRQVIKLVKE